MTKFLLAAFVGLLSLSALAADPWSVSGSYVQSPKQSLDLNGKWRLITGSADPTIVPQGPAEPGSLYCRNKLTGPIAGYCYVKQDSGVSTSWTKINTTGPSGATGSTGPSGPTGGTGVTGASGSNGTNGSTGSSGATGASGSNGSAGSNGASGSTGATGTSGSNGSAGLTGATGASGTNGSAGAAGASGLTGASGKTGQTGATGPSFTGSNSIVVVTDGAGALASSSVTTTQLAKLSASTSTPFTASSIVERDSNGWILDDDMSYKTVFKEDFLGYQSVNSVGDFFTGDSSGTSASNVPAGGGICPDNGHIGCAPMNTGTTTSGRTAIYSGLVHVAGGGIYVLEWLMNMTALSNGTDTYTLLMGFCDVFSSNNADCTTNSPGYIQYTHSVNSGNLVLKAKNSTGTTTNSTTPMATGWHKFQIQVNGAGTLSTFLMDGVSMGTVNASIPTSIAAASNIVFDIVKSAGTTQTKMNIDYVWLRWKPTSPR